MGKALLISILVATVAIPVFLARDAKPKRGIRRTVTWIVVYCALWVLACAFVIPKIM
jgi:hypothetical protein